MTNAAEPLTRQATERPDSIALYDHDGRGWSFGALNAAAEQVSSALAEQGTKPGDRVLVACENSAATVVAFFAALKLGAWAVPVNARLSAPELDRVSAHARPVVALFTSHASSEATAHAARYDAQDIAFGLALAAPHPSAPADVPGVSTLLYTTGTTGAPKGVMLTHDNLLFGGQASATLREMREEDVIYGALPMSHVFGLTSMLMAGMISGASLKLEARFSPDRLYAALQDGVTLLPAVPQMHALLMAYAEERGITALNSTTLRYVSSGAAPLDPVWKRKAETFYGIALQNGYGMTEASAGVCATRNPMGVPDVSVGPPLPGVELRIDGDAPGGGDGTGEVLIKGGNVMAGYFENPQETAKVLSADSWLRSGDLGRIDDAGNLHILGRSKELIIRGGFNIYPPEVEAALNDHPQVIQSAVLGRRTKTGDEEVIAFVQIPPQSTLTAQALADFAAQTLTPYKRPARIILTESLPAAATGKLLKHKMLAHFAEHL